MRRLRAVSLLLALLLLLAPMPTASAAVNGVYVGLGDSIASGYGLANPNDGYVQLLGKLEGAAKTVNLGVPGLDSAGLLTALDALNGQQRGMLTSAKLITVSIGSNDLLGPFLALIAQAAGTIDPVQIFANPAKLAAVQAALASPATLGMFTSKVQGFSVNLPKIVAKIRAINGTAKLVFTNAYNPYKGIAIAAPGIAFDLGQYGESFIQPLNQVYAAFASSFTLVDLYSAFDSGYSLTKPLVNATTGASFDPHPTKLGHALIAAAIQKAITEKPKPVEKPKYVATVKKNANVYHTDGPLLGVLKKGSPAVVYSVGKTYTKIAYAGGAAYVKNDTLTRYSIKSPKYKLGYITQDFTVMSKATYDSKKLGTACKYTAVLVYSATANWAKIQYGSGYGYVRTTRIVYP